MASPRVGGIIELKVNGSIYNAKGNFTYNLGRPRREAVVGADAVHGFKETPQAPFIEGEITDSAQVNLEALVTLKDATAFEKKADKAEAKVEKPASTEKAAGTATSGDDAPAHLVAVRPGQVPVEDDDVIGRQAEMVESVVAVQRHVDRHALAAQAGRDRPSQDLVVLGHQHAHPVHDARSAVSARCRPRTRC